MQRQRIVWTGFPGSPGLGTLYFVDAASSQTALRTMLNALVSTLPPDVHIHIEPGGDVIDESTGVLTGSWAGNITADVQGTSATTFYSAPAGYLIRWETATVRNGSRLRGRTYMVPATSAIFSPSGGLEASTQASIAGAVSAFVGAVTPNLLVWQRPRKLTTAYVDGRGIPHKGLPARPGSSAVVVSSSVPTESVVLRSRRD